MIQQLHHASWLLSDAYPRLSAEATDSASREDLEWAVSVSALSQPIHPFSIRSVPLSTSIHAISGKSHHIRASQLRLLAMHLQRILSGHSCLHPFILLLHSSMSSFIRLVPLLVSYLVGLLRAGAVSPLANHSNMVTFNVPASLGPMAFWEDIECALCGSASVAVHLF